MKNYIFWLIMYVFINSDVYSQTDLFEDPNHPNFIVSDIDRFWKAFDLAKGKSKDKQVRIYKNIYIDSATTGFKSWLEKRNKSTNELVAGINSMIPFYESIRKNTLNISMHEKEVRAGFYALKYLYPKAKFPDVYFFIWFFFNSGSTTTDEGLMIAAETQSVHKNTPLDIIPEIHRKMVISMNLKTLSALVVHESIHEQQKDYKPKNLLEKAIREGSADFIAELCTGKNPSIAAHTYANPREEELWKEFKSVMYGTDYTGWTGIPSDRPAGLAYWIGYKIVESFYDRQTKKISAIETLIDTTDYQSIFEQSGYVEKFN